MPVQGASHSSAGGPTTIMNTQDGYLVHNENDMEVLADYEEEQQRRGHFNLIFPLARNIDTYRPYFNQQRRNNLVLWSYLKQGCPVSHV